MKAHIKSVLALAVFVSFAQGTLRAQEVNYKIHAMFMYHFSRYVDWPESKKSGEFIICVLGNSDLLKELDIIASAKKAGSQTIVIKKISTPAEAVGAHMVFIPLSHSSKVDEVVQAVSSKPVLIVSEKSGLAQKGSGINFIISDDKLKFEINKASIEGKSLKVSGDLVKLGIVI